MKGKDEEKIMEQEIKEKKVKMSFKNMMKSIWFQLTKKNAFRSIFITHNAFGIFSKNSHINQHTGVAKVTYSKKSAIKSAEKMSEKFTLKEGKPIHFSYYKCAFCDGYHIGKNRQNKTKQDLLEIENKKKENLEEKEV